MHGFSAENDTRPEAPKRAADLVFRMVVGTGVDPVTYRFSGDSS